jgi:hypothetical protein
MGRDLRHVGLTRPRRVFVFSRTLAAAEDPPLKVVTADDGAAEFVVFGQTSVYTEPAPRFFGSSPQRSGDLCPGSKTPLLRS